MGKLSPETLNVLEIAQRAPSVHNAQGWRLLPETESSFTLAFAHEDHLLSDPDDRDAFLAIGAYYEGLALLAEDNGMKSAFAANYSDDGRLVRFGSVSLRPLNEGEAPDALAKHAKDRQTDRHAYQKSAIPPALADELRSLGMVLTRPSRVAKLVEEASVLSWKDYRFIADLQKWIRYDDKSPDGMTVDCLGLSKTDQAALKYALWRGQLAAPIAKVYARRDVMLTKRSGAVAVLPATSREPLALFEAGRRLLRAWVTITAAGYSYHPISVVIDQGPTVRKLAQLTGVPDAVAIFRVGYCGKPAPWSKRRPLIQAFEAH